MAGKLASREGFTLEDFLEQMMAIRKMGPIANLLGMLPGAGRDEGAAQADRRPRPRPHRGDHPVDDARRSGSTPKIINASRRVRIANGSGVSVTDVNQLLERFAQAQKMMSQMAGSMGLPGMGPMSKKAARPADAGAVEEGQEGQGQGAKGGPGPPADGRPRPAARRRLPRRRGCPGGMPGPAARARACPTSPS